MVRLDGFIISEIHKGQHYLIKSERTMPLGHPGGGNPIMSNNKSFLTFG